MAGHRRINRTDDVIEAIIKYSKQPKITSADIVATLRVDFPMIKITLAKTSLMIATPSVIVTDYDKAFKRALRLVFEDVQHQICLWHVMKNVAFNTKKRWKGQLEGTALGERGDAGSHLPGECSPEALTEEGGDFAISSANYNDIARRAGTRLLRGKDRDHHLRTTVKNPHNKKLGGRTPPGSNRKWLNNTDGILSASETVVYANTEQEFWSEWRLLKSKFTEQNNIISYLEETYLPIKAEFAHHCIKNYRNFGIRVTSRTEGAHGILKRLIKTRRADLNGLCLAIEETLERLKENFAFRYSQETSKAVMNYNHYVIKPLRYLVGFPDEPLSAEFLRLHNEDDPEPVKRKRNQAQTQNPIVNGPQPLPTTAYTDDELRILDEAPRDSASVRCDPAHDALNENKRTARGTDGNHGRADGDDQQLHGCVSADQNTVRYAVWVWDGARDGFTGDGHTLPERLNTSLDAAWVTDAGRDGFTSSASASANGNTDCHGAEA
ncbi:hypothetical protein OQA88_13286 [Cercophora sp. LCS_1]